MVDIRFASVSRQPLRHTEDVNVIRIAIIPCHNGHVTVAALKRNALRHLQNPPLLVHQMTHVREDCGLRITARAPITVITPSSATLPILKGPLLNRRTHRHAHDFARNLDTDFLTASTSSHGISQ